MHSIIVEEFSQSDKLRHKNMNIEDGIEVEVYFQLKTDDDLFTGVIKHKGEYLPIVDAKIKSR